MKHTLVLFDIDGTILLSGGAGPRAMARAGRQLFGDHFTLDGFDTSGMLDPIIFAQLARRFEIADHHTHHDSFRDIYLRELQWAFAEGGDRVNALPGVMDALGQLRRREDVMLGILSGNYIKAVPIKFGPIDVDPRWFEIVALGDEGDSRPDLTALAMRRYEQRTGHAADPKRVLVIGDTPRDIDCAHAHGCIAIAVATGRFSIEELKAAGADLVLPDLSDFEPVLAMIDGVNAC